MCRITVAISRFGATKNYIPKKILNTCVNYTFYKVLYPWDILKQKKFKTVLGTDAHV